MIMMLMTHMDDVGNQPGQCDDVNFNGFGGDDSDEEER